MRKKILCSFFASLVLMQNVSANELEIEKAYMLGAFHAMEQMQRNLKVQGINKDRIDLNKYIVALDVSTLATYKVLLYQQIGYTESLTPLMVNDKYLVFNSYDRKADAIYLQEKILNSFHFKNKEEKSIIIENNTPQGWYKSQFVQKEIYDTLISEVNKNVKGKVFVVKEDDGILDKKLNMIEEQNKKENIQNERVVPEYKGASKVEKIPNVVMKNKVKEPDNLIRFRLKNFTTFFSYPSWTTDAVLKREKFSPKGEAKIFTNHSYRYLTVKKDSRGDEWVKLFDSNTWVKKNDIEILN